MLIVSQAPYEGYVDLSNSLFAVLALNTGRRLGFGIPKETWLSSVEFFLKNQDPDGPEVKYFRVPAADFPISKLISYIEKLDREHRKYLKKAKNGEKRTMTTVDPYSEFGTEAHKMKARGWGYYPIGAKPIPGTPPSEGAMGSTTTCGIAGLLAAKAAVEGMDIYKKKYRARVDQGIRDGFAWLAYNFTVKRNPLAAYFFYYYLYGLERAGVLGIVNKIGAHDWYELGSAEFLAHQKPDGSWPGEPASDSSSLTNTCWAVIFLCKATTPLVRISPGISTGANLLPKDNK